MVFSKGVCCADDAFHAHIAKNLADGFGYSATFTPLRDHYFVSLFEPQLGVGPALLLPAALAIKIFGNTYWAPGLAEVSLWFFLLLLIGFTVNRIFSNGRNLTIAAFLFFVFSYIFSVYHFEEWYSLLGEVITAGFLILAFLTYYSMKNENKAILTGFIFSLSVLSKLIAFLPFASFVLFILLDFCFSNKNDIRNNVHKLIRNLAFLFIGFVIPIILFEIWKVIDLHIIGYINYIKDYFNYVNQLAVSPSSNLVSRVSERILTAFQRFGIFIPSLLVIFALMSYFIRKDKTIFSIFASLTFAFTLFTIYWLILSNGWARYYYIGLLIGIFLLVLPICSSAMSYRIKAPYMVVLIMIGALNLTKVNIMFPFAGIHLFKASNEVVALTEVSNILTTNLDRRPFLTQWWATAIDVEYSMKSHLNFTSYNDSTLDYSKAYIVVVNKKFLDYEDEKFKAFLAKCGTKEIENYYFIDCRLPLSEILPDS